MKVWTPSSASRVPCLLNFGRLRWCFAPIASMSKGAKREAILEKHILKISKVHKLAKLTPKRLRRKLETSLQLRDGKLDKMKVGDWKFILMFLDGLFVTVQAKIVEIALKHIPMPKDDDIVSVKTVSVEKQIEKRKRAAEEAGAIIDVAATKVGFWELRTR